MNALVEHDGTGTRGMEGTNKFLSISMGEEVYGIEVLRIKEIIEYGGITSVPMMPDFIRGAFNLRGRGVPILDLSIRFGGSATETGRRTCVVIVEAQADSGERFDVGLLVDAVNEVVDVEPGSVEPAPTLGGKLRTDFLKGMAKVEGKFIILLALDRILLIDDVMDAVKHTSEV